MTQLDLEISKDIQALKQFIDVPAFEVFGLTVVNILTALHEQSIMIRERLQKLDGHTYL